MSKQKTIFLTGATGFVGRHLVAALLDKGFKVIAGVRSTKSIDPRVETRKFVLNEYTDVDLEGVDCVIHLAGLAHTVNASAAHLNEINHVGTQRISNLAAKQGVEKFIFLSSIGVHGNSNSAPFNETSLECPYNDYTESKYHAEQALTDATKNSRMQSFIIRAPLIYGKDAPGNFSRLIKFANSNIPLPFGAIKNTRSFCSVSNICDFIICCVENDSGLQQLEKFVVADNETVSTPALFSAISGALGKRPKVIGVPQKLLRLCFRAGRKKQLEMSLMDDLTVDNSYAKVALGWEPKVSLMQELEGLNRV